MEKKTKKKSVAKKLIPATSMLLVSATMLASSTYAWFTMSREVEVTGLKMTATVPEDFQISLGRLAVADHTAAETSENGVSLANSTGTLFGSASNLGASAPEKTWDWSNSADVSAYYAFGRLMPASSTTGESIYYTPDANGVGKTVAVNGSFYKANDALFTRATGSTTTVSADATGTNLARATLHAYTAKTNAAVDTAHDTWTTATTSGTDYTQAISWQETKDDGYYVDVPIWIRTSSNENVTLSVDGYVIPGKSWTGTRTETELELYRAVRVALLDGEADTNDSTAAGAAAVSTTNIIPLKDAWQKKDGHTASTTYQTTDIASVADPWSSSLTSIVDSANLATTGRTLPSALVAADQAKYAVGATDQLFAGVSSAATTQTDPDGDGNATTYAGTYANYTCLTPTSAGANVSTVATVPGSTTSGNYGAAKKLIIRVWLDGEDGECWNDNAGQDWAISLRFSKIEA